MKATERDAIAAIAIVAVVVLAVIVWLGDFQPWQALLSVFDRSPLFWIGLALAGSGAFAVWGGPDA